MNNDIQSTAVRLMHLMDRLRRLGPGNAPPREAKISPSQLALISYTSSNPGCGVQTLAEGLNLATPTVSISIRQLEKIGLMERQPDPHDGRAVLLFLTPEGQELHQRTLQFRCQKFTSLLTGLTHQERSTLLNLLEKAVSTAEIKEQGNTK
ncbi:MAG: MarR family winged helix-turn-helix transcriptional regulator [Anaerolineales bacterium]|nr:MarR family winged helix-turn-helix transcriptional regulator [Anaerolineales bacterium]